MSHFTVGVVITKDDIERNKKNLRVKNFTDLVNKKLNPDEAAITKAVDEALIPFCENLEVEPYRVLDLHELHDKLDEIVNYEGDSEYKLKIKEKYKDKSLEFLCENYFGYMFREDGAYSTYNSDSKWDWYVIGGRWDNTLPIKNHTKTEDENYDGYNNKLEGNMCQIKDLELHKELNKEEIENYTKAYNDMVNGKGFYNPEYILEKYPTLQVYLDKQCIFSTYALLNSKGQWLEPGKMGWFGCSTATSEDEIKYENEYKEKVLAEDPESYFVMVDCHI